MNQPTTPEPSSAWRRQHTWCLLALLLLALVMRTINLGFPYEKTFDEIYYVKAAYEYLDGKPDSNSVHPPLAKIQLAGAVLVFEVSKSLGLHNLPETVGWRYFLALMGTGVVALTAWLAMILTRNPRLSLLATALVAVEHLSVSESRITTLDNIQVFWITLATCCAAQRLFRSNQDAWLWASALAMGVATACKWNGLFAAFGVSLALMGLVRLTAGGSEEPVRLSWARFFKVPLVMALCISAVYVLSYLPYRNLYPEKDIPTITTEVLKQHERMIKFRYDEKQFKHTYISQFYQWPFVVRPIWFHYKTQGQNCTGIVAFGMIPFWWLAFYLLLETSVSCWRRENNDPVGQFLVLAYLSQWLLWASSTTGGFFYYMLPLVPLMAILVARTLEPWTRTSGSSRWAYGYLLMLGILVVLYYPFMVGLSVPTRYFQMLFFMPNWI